MSDTTELMTQIMKKGTQLSDVYISAQYTELAQSSEFFDELIKDLSEDEKNALIDGGVATLDGFTSWLNRQDPTSSIIQSLNAKIEEAAAAYDLTSDVYKE